MDMLPSVLHWLAANLAALPLVALFLVAFFLVAQREFQELDAQRAQERVETEDSWYKPPIIRFILPALFWALFFNALVPIFKRSGDFGPSFLEYNIAMPIVSGTVIFLTALAMHFQFSNLQEAHAESRSILPKKGLGWAFLSVSVIYLVVLPALTILDSVSSDRNFLGDATTLGRQVSFWHWLNGAINRPFSILPAGDAADLRFFVRGVIPFLMAFVIAIFTSLDRLIEELSVQPRISEYIRSQRGERKSSDSQYDVFRTIGVLAVVVVIVGLAIRFANYPVASFFDVSEGAVSENSGVMTLIANVHISTWVILAAIVGLFLLFLHGVITICVRCTAKVALGALATLLVGRSGGRGRDETSRHGVFAFMILFLTFTTFILEHEQRFPGATFAIQTSSANLTGTAKVLYVVDEVAGALIGDVFDVYKLSVPQIFNTPPEYLTTDPDLIQLGFDFTEVTHQPRNFFLSLFVLAFRTALVGALLVILLGRDSRSEPS